MKKLNISGGVMRLAAIAVGVVASGYADDAIASQLASANAPATGADTAATAEKAKQNEYIKAAIMIAGGFLLPSVATMAKMKKLQQMFSDIGDIFMERGVTTLLVTSNVLGTDLTNKISMPFYLPTSVNNSQDYVGNALMLTPTLDGNAQSFINCPPIVTNQDIILDEYGNQIKFDVNGTPFAKIPTASQNLTDSQKFCE